MDDLYNDMSSEEDDAEIEATLTPGKEKIEAKMKIDEAKAKEED